MEIKNKLTNKNTKVGRVSADGLRGQKDAQNFYLAMFLKVNIVTTIHFRIWKTKRNFSTIFPRDC